MNAADALDAALGRCPIVGVVRGCPASTAAAVAVAAAEAGLAVVEFTMDRPDAAEALAAARAGVGDGTLIGAGTVRTVVDVEHAVAAGAQFLVAPATRPPVIAAAGPVPFIPGVHTATEVEAAAAALADIGQRPLVKLFPASTGGPQHLRALRGPLPETRFVCTGGIGVDDIDDYLAAGAAGVGVGSSVFDPDALVAGDVVEIGRRVRDAVSRSHRRRRPLGDQLPQEGA